MAVARGALYKDDDEEKVEAIIRGVAGEMLADPVPIIGRHLGEVVSGRYMNSGITIVPGAKYLARAGQYATEQEWEKAAGQAARGLSLFFGLPMTGSSKALNAITEHDLAELLGWER